MNTHQKTAHFKFLETKLELINRFSEELRQLLATSISLFEDDSYTSDSLTKDTLALHEVKVAVAYGYLEELMKSSTMDELSDIEERLVYSLECKALVE